MKAVNDELAQEDRFLMRLAVIDPTGFTDQEKTSQDLLIRHFETDEEGAEFKEWEMPVNQMDGIYATYPRLASSLSFTTVKDYDDWIARLHAHPRSLCAGHREHGNRHGRPSRAAEIPCCKQRWTR